MAPDERPPRRRNEEPMARGETPTEAPRDQAREHYVVRPSGAPPRELPALGDEAPHDRDRRRPDGERGDQPPHIDAPLDHRVSRPRVALDQAGPLVLIGGACTPHGDALQRFLELAEGHEGGRIIGLTSASSDPERSAVLWRADFTDAGARHVHIPVVRRRRDAESTELAARILDADGIFLGGGDQVQLVSVLSGTPVGHAIRNAWARGAVVCGTSAGAAALTELTLAGGEIDEDGALVEMYVGPGLGLLGFHALVDTHFGARRRLHRLVVAIANNAELMGLGIDEDTALVVQGHVGEVVGAGGVTFVDGRTVRFDDAKEVGTGRQRTVSHLRVGIVGTGHRLDLRERELAQLVDEGVRVDA